MSYCVVPPMTVTIYRFEGSIDVDAALQFSGIHGGKANRNQDERPKRKNVKRFAECNQPFRRIVRQQGGQIRGQWVLGIDCSGWLQEQNQQEERCTDNSHQTGVRNYGKCLGKPGSRASEKIIGPPHDEAHKQSEANRH